MPLVILDYRDEEGRALAQQVLSDLTSISRTRRQELIILGAQGGARLFFMFLFFSVKKKPKR